MLIFEEATRPSFVEMENLFIENEAQAMKSISNGKTNAPINDYILLYN